jgi:hypothetical protein
VTQRALPHARSTWRSPHCTLIPARSTPQPFSVSTSTLVKWAQKCDSAEQLGEKIRQRYERAHPPSRHEMAEFDAELDRLLAD